MRFRDHSRLIGSHAFLSASNYHWINYDEEKLDARFFSAMQAARGTRYHNLAKELIEMGIKLPDTTATLNRYVNDAIYMKMTPEQVLYYSDNIYGTADAISFTPARDGLPPTLRIHDLKMGVIPASIHQLEVYAALFCHEYGFKPAEIYIELRIYQSDDVQIYVGDPGEITRIMSVIIAHDERIDLLRQTVI